jgi:acyl carrier protein
MESTFAAPSTAVEEVLAQIWAEILGLERVGIHDNFFELGGHSLLAIRIIARVYDSCQVELPLGAIFEAPTIAGLARLLTRAHSKPTRDRGMNLPMNPGCGSEIELLAQLDQLSDADVDLLLRGLLPLDKGVE